MGVETTKQGNAVIVKVAGRLDAVLTPAFDAACEGAIAAGEKTLLIDMRDLAYISSMGLRSFVSAGKKLGASGGTLMLCGMGGLVRNVFQISGLLPYFTLFDSPEAGLANVRHAPPAQAAASPADAIRHVTWEKLEQETLGDRIKRQTVHGSLATAARFHLAAGAVVTRHAHVNEQFSMVLSGALRLEFDARQITVRPGDLAVIPPNVPHAATALEDTVVLDFFTPTREDSIRRDDAYLRGDTTGAR